MTAIFDGELPVSDRQLAGAVHEAADLLRARISDAEAAGLHVDVEGDTMMYQVQVGADGMRTLRETTLTVNVSRPFPPDSPSTKDAAP